MPPERNNYMSHVARAKRMVGDSQCPRVASARLPHRELPGASLSPQRRSPKGDPKGGSPKGDPKYLTNSLNYLLVGSPFSDTLWGTARAEFSGQK